MSTVLGLCLCMLRRLLLMLLQLWLLLLFLLLLLLLLWRLCIWGMTVNGVEVGWNKGSMGWQCLWAIGTMGMVLWLVLVRMLVVVVVVVMVVVVIVVVGKVLLLLREPILERVFIQNRAQWSLKSGDLSRHHYRKESRFVV